MNFKDYLMFLTVLNVKKECTVLGERPKQMGFVEKDTTVLRIHQFNSQTVISTSWGESKQVNVLQDIIALMEQTRLFLVLQGLINQILKVHNAYHALQDIIVGNQL